MFLSLKLAEAPSDHHNIPDDHQNHHYDHQNHYRDRKNHNDYVNQTRAPTPATLKTGRVTQSPLMFVSLSYVSLIIVMIIVMMAIMAVTTIKAPLSICHIFSITFKIIFITQTVHM